MTGTADFSLTQLQLWVVRQNDYMHANLFSLYFHGYSHFKAQNTVYVYVAKIIINNVIFRYPNVINMMQELSFKTQVANIKQNTPTYFCDTSCLVLTVRQ